MQATPGTTAAGGGVRRGTVPIVPVDTAANYNARAGDLVTVDASAAARTVFLPPTPSAGDSIQVQSTHSSTFTVTVDPSGKTINGDPTATIVSGGAGATFTYTGTEWRIAALVFAGDLSAIPAFATPAVVLGTAPAAGVATTIMRSDATIVAFDATVPVTQAFGDTAAAGSVAVAARRNHKHAMPAAPTPANVIRVTPAAFASTVTPNADTTDVLNIGQLTGALTLAAPTGTPVDGQTLRVRLLQDGTGSRVITYNAAYAFGTDITAAMDPSAANSKWERIFEWNATDSKWRATGIVRGF